MTATPARVAPNPASPFGNADPAYRHLLEGFGPIAPKPGILTPTACERLAVAPDGPLPVTDIHPQLPPGLCPVCLDAARGAELPRPDAAECTACGSLTRHDVLCAMCRQDAHEAWTAAGRPWRALTIKQPYADAIVHTTHPKWGRKTVENRTWPAPEQQIGTRILIHAGKTADRRALDAGILPGPDARGAVIGTAVLAGCHLQSLGLCELKGCGPWAELDTFHWELTDVRPLEEPIPVTGALQLWKPPVDVLAMVVDQKSARTPATASASAGGEG